MVLVGCRSGEAKTSQETTTSRGGWTDQDEGTKTVVERELQVTVESEGATPLLRVAGEVDIQTSPILEMELNSLLDQGTTSILVDLAGVTFLDSTGLSVLIAGLKRCQTTGGDLRLQSPRPNVLRVLEITGLTDAFQVGGASDQAPAD
jgi:anti-sigma B factor antagonist